MQSAWAKGMTGVLLLAAVFMLGVNFGNSRLHIVGVAGENGSLPARLDDADVQQVYGLLKQHFDGSLTASALNDGLKTGLVNAAGDPYTEYFSAKDAQAFNDQLAGTFTGIGAVLGQDASKDLIIISPVSGSPAAKAGLQGQDVIEEINGKSTANLSVDSAVAQIRGPKGTKVTLKIARNKTQELTVTITRDDIKVPSVTSKILDGNIGYLQITQFSDDTSQLAQKAAQQFAQAHVKGIVLDMRDNPGGLLDAAVDVSSLWVPDGQLLLQEKRGSSVVNTYVASGDDVLHGIPTAVLVNGGSASAAEITAGALHDDHEATIFGEKSFGKGSVQQIFQLNGGAEMKITVARWYRPNGQNIDKKGITPDQVVTLSDSDAASGNDTQKAAALAWLQTQH